MTISRLAIASRPRGGGVYDIGPDADGNLDMVRDAEAVGQHARQRLGTFYGEWFLDTECGVPWLEQIMGRQFDRPLAEAVIKKELLETDGVTGIGELSIGFDRRTRGIAVPRAKIETEYDEEAAF